MLAPSMPKKTGTIKGKGVINCAVSSVIFKYLEANGIHTHFVKQLGERDMLVKRVDIIMVEVVIRNFIAGSLAKRTGKPEGEKLPEVLLEWYYKSDPLDDPMLNKEHIRIFKWATTDEVSMMEKVAKRVNELLVPYFEGKGLILIDYKLEFGRHAEALAKARLGFF